MPDERAPLESQPPTPRRRTVIAVILCLAALGTSCASRGPTFGWKPDKDLTQRVAREYAPYRLRGYGLIQGWAGVTSAAERQPARQTSVKLVPITSHSREFVQTAFETGEWSTTGLTRSQGIVWSTLTDMDGQFDFDQLPRGRYYLIAPVQWLDRAGETHERTLVQEVALGEAQTLKVTLAADAAAVVTPPE